MINGKGVRSEVDPISAKKLNAEYQMTNQAISELTWTTKANVNRVLINGAKNYETWKIYELTKEEEEILKMMLKEHKFEYGDGKRDYYIKNDGKEKICFISHDGVTIRCLFDEDFPDTLKQLAINEHMNLYNELDYEVLKRGVEDSVLKKPCIFLDSDSKKIFDKAAKKRGIKGLEYANFLGFEKHLTEKDTNRDSRIKQYLEEHSEDGIVSISSSPENQWIRSYASRCNMSIEEFLSFFGYNKSKYDYDYINQKRDDKYREELVNYIVEEPNLVYISTQKPIYRTLYAIAKRDNVTVDEYIRRLGYQRVLKSTKIQELSEEIDKIIEEEKRYLEKEKITIEKIKRNKNLTDKLKRAYNYECQLCSEHQRMVIRKSDGTNYVEVHHINQLSLEFDEEGTLDRVNNLIVVCPNHHKILHYHNGGYSKIKKKNGELVFENDSPDIIPIIVNKHLKEKRTK